MEKNIVESLYRLMRNLRRMPKDDRHPSRSYMRLLYSLEDKESLSARELAKALDIRPSSLSELLERMEREGAVVRIKDKEDMRIVRISLGEEGKSILDKHKEDKKEEENKLSSWLTHEEKEDFIRIANKLSQKLEEKDYLKEDQRRKK